MAHIVATNVTSPLGMTTQENYAAVKTGRSMLRRYDRLPSHGQAQNRSQQLPEPFCASLFTYEQQQAMAIDGFTRFESLVVHSINEALSHCPTIDITVPNVVFILSTTKANVELLPHASPIIPGEAAQRIASHLGITTTPIVVCNACISGVAAITLAQRLLDSRQYDHAVVCGADVQCLFTVAGFQSLKAVSADACRPFDMERTGLNLGEAAATMVLSGSERWEVSGERWEVSGEKASCCIEAGVIRNDAFHISSPSKNGEGAWLALKAITSLPSAPEIPEVPEVPEAPSAPSAPLFINAHGTATMFNDQMESVAIERAGLADIPVNGLKGYYGHTLGAAGVLETVISLAAFRDHTILATRGFEERGVSGKISVTSETVTVEAGTERALQSLSTFLKMISGFGGGNAVIKIGVRGEERGAAAPAKLLTPHSLLLTHHRVTISPTSVTIDGQPLQQPLCLTDLYKHYVGDYPKFYKMDGLSRLGFLASELLLQAESDVVRAGTEPTMLVGTGPAMRAGTGPAPTVRAGTGPAPTYVERAVVLFNSSSSIDADRKFQTTIAPDNFFPSPSVFVYTLPNIVTGEIAMRNGYHGETSFYILPERNDALMRQIVLSTFHDCDVKSILTGWLDYFDENDYEADLMLITKG